MYVVWTFEYERTIIFQYDALQSLCRRLYTVATPSIGHLKYAMSLFEMIFYKR